MIWLSTAPLGKWALYMAVAYGVYLIACRFTDDGSKMPLERGNFGKEISLRQALGRWAQLPTIVGLLAITAFLWATRIYIGMWSWRDAAAVALLVAGWPLIEWFTHVYLLHAKPIQLGPFRFDSIFARIHRAHHRNPYHESFGIAPWAALVQYSLLIPGVFLLVTPWPRSITMSAMAATLVCNYELWHYLYHSSYKPKSVWFRRLRNHHWWHHFQHERNWFGVTNRLGDLLLGTAPHPKTIEPSATCRTLGHEAPAAPADSPAIEEERRKAG